MLRLSLTFTSLLLCGALTAQATEFVASLDGAQETPPNPSTARGKMNVALDASNFLTFKLVHDGLSTGLTAGHFHKGAVGVMGGVVIGLTNPVAASPTIWAGVTSRALTAAEVTDLRAGLWYMNVHSVQYPNGEIRGQLVAATLPTTFGTGCMGSNSKVPTITGRSFPVANNNVFRINLANSKETSLAFLLVGTSKTNWLGIPLPFDLTVIGMTGCTAYCNDTGLGGPGTATDALGAAFIPILIPYDYSIVGAVLYSQWIVVDTAANTLGLTTSNALEYKIQ